MELRLNKLRELESKKFALQGGIGMVLQSEMSGAKLGLMTTPQVYENRITNQTILENSRGALRNDGVSTAKRRRTRSRGQNTSKKASAITKSGRNISVSNFDKNERGNDPDLYAGDEYLENNDFGEEDDEGEEEDVEGLEYEYNAPSRENYMDLGERNSLSHPGETASRMQEASLLERQTYQRNGAGQSTL